MPQTPYPSYFSTLLLLLLLLLSMASVTKPTISIKLLVDQQTNKAVMAEVGNDFIDIIHSVLKLPLGNIARLVSKHQSVPPGCLNNLYNSVENLGLNSFRTDECKSMLLYPRSIPEDKPKNLKLPMDLTEPTKYFVCQKWRCYLNPGPTLSYYETSRCSCGELMNKEVNVLEAERQVVKDESEGESMFFITDDLRVTQGLPGNLINHLYVLGIKNVNHIAVEVLEIGSEEMSNILSHSLFSKTTLTDVFLRNEGSINITQMRAERVAHVAPETNTKKEYGKTSVKIIIRKSDRKILYAEASEDFVDLLFSFLTIPLESVLRLLRGGKGDLELGSMSNLFGDLDTIFSILKDKNSRNVLLPSFYSCPIEFPTISSQDPPVYYGQFKYGPPIRSSCFLTSNGTCMRNYADKSVLLRLFDTKSPKWDATNSSGYVKKKSLFVVTDGLEVKSLSSLSSISLLQELGVLHDDIEQRVINIGEAEALALLRACMCSSSPLSVLLDVSSKQPKREPLQRGPLRREPLYFGSGLRFG